MANIKEVCLLLLVGIVVVATAEPFTGGFHHFFGCLFKRCHRYAKCEVQNLKPVCVCPKACPRNYSPVCGTNWKTYSNYCALKRDSCASNNRTRLHYYGTCKSGSCRRTPWRRLRCPYYSKCQLIYGLPRCACPETCSFRYKPVCGSDRKNYRNSCVLRKTACKQRKFLRVEHPGHCRPDPCARIDCCCNAECRVNETNHAKCECNFACTFLYDPVCGSDGRTYGNACGLRSAACAQQSPSLRVVSKGPCSTTPPVTTTSFPSLCPTCAYYSKCEVENGSASCVCPSLCPAVVRPVCGSNGVTYGNLCELKRDSCKKQQFIEVTNEGTCLNSTGNEVSTVAPTTLTPCAVVKCGFFATCEVINGSASCVCAQSCSNVSKPVCGSDGVTYESICELEKSSCQQQKNITVVKQGMCGSTLSCPIPRICLIACDREECAKKGWMCCCLGCGYICTQPITLLGRNVCPPAKDLCSTDDECPSGKKCCVDGCVKQCVPGVPTVDSEMKTL